jgi:16S rRNA (uracil1498-N3)-methyltransferase
MPPRLYVDAPLATGADLELPPGAARHAQVLRLQPGDTLVLFDGRGGEHAATVTQMGRSAVAVRVGAHDAVERELACAVTLALGMPANERMDTLVEKATELGAAAVAPLVCERSVLRLQGERAAKKQRHWQGVAIAAAEQSGRTRLPRIEGVTPFAPWIDGLARPPGQVRWLLDPGSSTPLAQALVALPHAASVVVLSGPEGGLSPSEQALARNAGFVPVGLGPRVLRADTAPLAAFACLATLASLRPAPATS